jgi:antitoxin component HigA of HigAB toxin-antitoxin module
MPSGSSIHAIGKGVEMIAPIMPVSVEDPFGDSPKDLKPMVGRRNRVYEALNRKRALTLPMIRRLHTGLGIPAECLIRPIVNT